MRQMFVIISACSVIAGCASNPLGKVPDLANRNLGEVTAILSYSDQLNRPDETQKLRHWRYYRAYYAKDLGKDAILASEERLIKYEPYCTALGGKISEPTHETNSNSVTKIEIMCTRKNDGAAIFRVAMGYETISIYKSQVSQKGACVSLKPNDPIYSQDNVSSEKYPVLCRAWLDAFQWKTPGTFEDVDAEYKVGLNGFDTIENVDMQLRHKQDLLERQQQERKREIEAQIQLRDQEMVLQRERAIRDLPKVKSIGQKICRTIEITQRKVMGYAMGEPVYGEAVRQQANITAFTENVAGEKIQIRISGIQANGVNLDRIDGTVVMQNGAVIWDEASKWGLCY